MLKRARPWRFRLFALALAVVVAGSVAATWPVLSFGSQSTLGVVSGSQANPVLLNEAVHAAQAGPKVGVTGSSTLPSGASETFGVVASVPFPAGSDPLGVAPDDANGNVYVTIPHNDTVAVINGSTQKIIDRIPLKVSPAGVVFDSMNSAVYVGSFFNDTVEVINSSTNTVRTQITVPGSPAGLASDNSNVYVMQQSLGTVSVISGSTNTITATVRVGQYPIAAAFDSENGKLYVVNYGSSNVSILNTSTDIVTGSIPVGLDPLGIAVDYGNGDLYVTNELSNNTTVISTVTEKAVTSVAVSPQPVGIAYDPKHSILAVATEVRDQVNIISNETNTVIANLSVGSLPVNVAFDSFNGYEYVSNSNSSNVSVIGTALHPPYPVTFTETGLPSGTNWTVTLNTTKLSSTSDVITFSEINGTAYPFSVGPISGYVASPASGSLTVAGFPVSEAVAFLPFTYTLTFQESGLPGGTTWSVILNSTPQFSSTSSLTFQEANGTYPYTVSPITGYSASPASGIVTINAGAQTVTISFAVPTKSSSGTVAGVPLWEWAAIAVVIAAVVIAIVLLMRRRPPAPATTARANAAASPPSTAPRPGGGSGGAR